VEKLMEMARKAGDQVEIYALDETADGVSFENAKLKDLESKVQSGLSLRLLKDGKLGFAYTKNLLNREELLQNAIGSLQGGVEGLFDLPVSKYLPPLNTYDPSIENLANATIVEECTRVCDIMTRKTSGQINVSAGRRMGKLRLMNSRGTDLSSLFSLYFFHTEVLYPGSYSSIQRQFLGKSFKRLPDAHLDYILELYNQSSKEVEPKGGKMKVLFLPETIYTLMWRVQSATNGRNVYQKVSPLLEKMGTTILSETLTVVNDPLNDRLPDARAFDDEGTPCQTLPIIDHGRLAHFYYDLHYAKKLNASPTGNGFKSSMWGGETVSFRPSPSTEHLFIQTGEKPLSDLVRSMDRGIIVAGVMGAHSGNILNGDFSVGLSPGLYVEKGEIIGHVKDAMVAGNVFDVLKELIDIEDTQHPGPGGTFPAILLDHVSVATKG